MKRYWTIAAFLSALLSVVTLSQKVDSIEPNLREPLLGDCVFYEHAERPLGMSLAVESPFEAPTTEAANNADFNDVASIVWIRHGSKVEAYGDANYRFPLQITRQYCTENGCWYDFAPGLGNDWMSSFKCLRETQ